jgi:hypothetical protein
VAHSQSLVSRGAIGIDLIQLESVDVPERPDPAPSPTAIYVSPAPEIAPETQVEPTSEEIDLRSPAPVAEPAAPPLPERKRMPMLELLGFADSDEQAAITAQEVDAAPVTPPPTRRRSPLAPTRPKAAPRSTAPVPRLADVHTGPTTENTGVLVARLWEATSEQAPLSEDWTPTETVEPPHRTFRWSRLSGALAIFVTLTLIAVAAYRWPISQANDLRVELSTNLATLESATEDIPAAVDLVTDPAIDPGQLAGIALPLLGFSEAANQAYTLATADHGSSIPLVSNAPLDALADAKAGLQRAADEALVIHERLGNILDYRILIARVLIVPDLLPVEASDAEISELGVTLSDMLAETTEVLLQLPDGDLTTGHRDLVESALAAMSSHVADYLAALRTENQFAASRLAGEMRQTSGAVSDALAPTLTQVAQWFDEALTDLQQRFDESHRTLQASRS